MKGIIFVTVFMKTKGPW